MVHMLTTVDNPYNPFTQFDEWYRFDESSGYHTTGYLARITISSSELSETDQSNAIEDAVLEAAELNPNGMYRLVPAPDGWNEDIVA